jgi:hypothetical protein
MNEVEEEGQCELSVKNRIKEFRVSKYKISNKILLKTLRIRPGLIFLS